MQLTSSRWLNHALQHKLPSGLRSLSSPWREDSVEFSLQGIDNYIGSLLLQQFHILIGEFEIK